MKARELLEQLSSVDPDMDVLCYTEDSRLLNEGMGFRILEIEAIDQNEAALVRLDDDTPYLKLGKSDGSKKLLILSVTGEF